MKREELRQAVSLATENAILQDDVRGYRLIVSVLCLIVVTLAYALTARGC